MMLYERMMRECVILEKQRLSDGEGGTITTWREGAHIMCAITQNNSMQAKIAEHDGVTSTFRITTSRQVKLDYHDVIKRIEDGVIFRVTSNAEEKASPSFSTIDMSVVSAERWELPNE